MAGVPRRGPAPLCLGLPEEIFGLEILVRLPSKDLVRCRAVCRGWRRVASTCDLLLAHHRRQPSLALVPLAKFENTTGGDLYAFDHRTGISGAEARLQRVARIDDHSLITVEASCDGLLLSVCTFLPNFQRGVFICNPTTRQIGRVPEKIQAFQATALYMHPPTGGYRLLLHKRSKELYGAKDPCYIFELGGCSQLVPRCIGRPPELAGFFYGLAMARGNLHWSWTPSYPSGKHITVFDTTSEAFRLIRPPPALLAQIQTGSIPPHLCEVDGTLGIYSPNDSMTVVDIWVMQDYDATSEVWSHKYHVTLPLASPRGLRPDDSRNVMVVHEETTDVFVLYNFGQTLVLADTKSKALAISRLDGYIVFPSTQRIEESLVRHSFFSALLPGALDDWPFISWLERGA